MESGLGEILKADWPSRGIAPRLEMVLQSRLATALLSIAIDGRSVPLGTVVAGAVGARIG